MLQFDALWGADGSIRIVDEDARLGANASYDTFMEGLSRELPKGVTVEKIDIALEQDFDTTGTPSRSWSVSANSNDFGVHTDPSVIQGLMREKGRVPKVHNP